ncbi:hypothetical protein M770_14430 [Pseudomonas aeruginosa VRFPA03]|nr:hypothetical protein M770_14430 [Pseudomonas aeruginosa VRFPA03]
MPLVRWRSQKIRGGGMPLKQFSSALVLAALLAGCSSNGDSPSTEGASVATGSASAPATTPAADGRCDANAVQAYVGKQASAAIVEEARRAAGAEVARALRPHQAATCAGLPSRRSTRLQAARVATEGINQARPCSASGRCSSHCGKSWPRPAAFRASSTPNARETSITGARMRVAECQRPMQKLSATSTMQGG